MAKPPKQAQDNHVVEENIRAIAVWEQAALHDQSPAERFAGAITRVMGSGTALLGHVLVFALWLAINTGRIPGVESFDPFPFPLLTALLSLEAILLSLVLLASQNRLSHQADKRAHLDLQIDLLAEREMTAVLRLLHDIAGHLKVPVSEPPEELRELLHQTDIHKLTDEVETIAADDDQERERR